MPIYDLGSLDDSKKEEFEEPKESVKENQQEEVIRITNHFQKQIKTFGKTVPISKLQEIYEFIKMNQSHLIDSISWAINTIRNKPEVKAQDPDKQYYRNFLKWNELREFLRTI